VVSLRSRRPALPVVLLADGASEMWNLLGTRLNERTLGVAPVALVDVWRVLEYVATASKLLEARERSDPGSFRRWKEMRRPRWSCLLATGGQPRPRGGEAQRHSGRGSHEEGGPGFVCARTLNPAPRGHDADCGPRHHEAPHGRSWSPHHDRDYHGACAASRPPSRRGGIADCARDRVHRTAASVHRRRRSRGDLLEPRGHPDGALALRALFELLPRHPVLTVASVIKLLDTTKPTAGRAIELLVASGVLAETTGKRRDRSFAYQRYLDRLRIGTELERDPLW
jgi:hypothetical protein